jgi:hypothetical protein
MSFENYIPPTTEWRPGSNRLTIEKYRTAPSTTGLGWVVVEKYDETLGKYKPLSSFRTAKQAVKFIEQHNM